MKIIRYKGFEAYVCGKNYQGMYKCHTIYKGDFPAITGGFAADTLGGMREMVKAAVEKEIGK